jgi:hypothetical protein
MASDLTTEQLREIISNPATIEQNAFVVLKNLSRLLNTEKESTCRDLVLRALENRAAFDPYLPILESLVRELGLYPYMDEDSLSLNDSIAYEFHRPVNYDEPIVFHREQAEVYRRLLNGENIILSAPTSFGKSKVIDALIAIGRFKNFVVIVPTIALIDETRRRLSRFSSKYKIITQISQRSGGQNVFIFTAERANVYQYFPRIDFFVIDEFYKIGALAEDQKRTVALNQAFYKLSKHKAQFYLLGPCVRQIPEGFETRFRCHFFPTNFSTVACQEIRIDDGGDELGTLCKLISELRNEPTLIFCKSPKRVNEVANALVEAGVTEKSTGLESAVSWMQDNFHTDWIMPAALRMGVGIHHGKIPRSLGQFVVRAFNDDRLKVLICTSTLIEGVNTKAKNVIIFDNTIAKQQFDFFTFNNIRGRSGRMFHHFVGRVFLFHEPPTEKLPFVDFPLFSQKPDAPDSILMQLDNDDLSAESKQRMEPFMEQTELPLELIRKHSSIEPSELIELAKHLKSLNRNERAMLSWSSVPNGDSLRFVCNLAWEFFIKRTQSGVFSSKQLAFKIWNLKFKTDIRQRILDELQPGPYAAATPNEAVERVLEFERTWASFELPRMLRGISDVTRHVLHTPTDFSLFAGQLENLFRSPFQVSLEEFGLPLQLTDKISRYLDGAHSIDEAISRLKKARATELGLRGFEKELFEDCQVAL